MTSGWQAPSSHALPDDRATEADGLVADARVMASRRSRPRRLLLPTILAAILAAEVTGLALARTISAPAPDAPAAAVAVTAPLAPTRPAVDLDRSATAPDQATGGNNRDLAAVPSAEQRTPTRGPDVDHRPVEAKSHLRVARESTRAKASGAASPSVARFRGTNRVWIPTLGINRSVQSFPCSRNRPPDAGMYRWGCSGRNNVYLLSHAWSTFKPLHDAYVGGRLKKGMKVVYADGSSRVHTYSVIWWKVTRPTTAASWAWASLSRPSMTLQTCVGSKSQYRLMVRLIRVA